MVATTLLLAAASALLAVPGGEAAPSSAHFAQPSSSHKGGWVLEEHLGNLSPYFDAPIPAGLEAGLPAGCEVEQLSLIHRHGSRHPISQEIGTINALGWYINNQSWTEPARKVAREFDFLRENAGWRNTLVTNDLSPDGRKQLFDHGVAYRLEYAHLNTTLFLAGEQDRVVESAQWFAAGYLGRAANETGTLDVISESEGVKSYITPMETCHTWSYSSGGDLVTEWGKVYLHPISARINNALRPAYPKVNFTADNVHGMLWACAYETATLGVGHSDWCGVFHRSEIEQFEYELDLLMRGAFGYGLPNNSAQVMGALFISNLTERLTKPESFLEADKPRQIFFDFAHDTTIDLILSTLGLAADKSFPTTGPVNPNRSWRTSYQVPFAAQMEWRKLACPNNQKRVQLVLNKAPVSLAPVCGKGKTDKFGSCDLNDWVKADKVTAANKIQVDDETWAKACGTPAEAH